MSFSGARNELGWAGLTMSAVAGTRRCRSSGTTSVFDRGCCENSDAGRPMSATSSLDKAHFTTRCFAGAIVEGAVGEIANVSHVFHPDGRLAAANSPYPLRLREPCMSPTGRSGFARRRPTNTCVARQADYTSAWSSIPSENIPLLF
jgi:hypothetical protein